MNFGTLSRFMSKQQFADVSHLLNEEERAFYLPKVAELVLIITTMPVTYQQDGLGDEAVVHLHYFMMDFDWYITEKDVDGGVLQAFGYADLGHGHPELGYICIEEIVRAGAELDLHWVIKTLRDVKESRHA